MVNQLHVVRSRLVQREDAHQLQDVAFVESFIVIVLSALWFIRVCFAISLSASDVVALSTHLSG